MEKKLLQMFPEGQWGLGQKAWMVKDGVYFCSAADIVDGEIVLTELGNRLLDTVEKSVASGQLGAAIFVADEDEIPVLVPKKPELKKTGLKAKHG